MRWQVWIGWLAAAGTAAHLANVQGADSLSMCGSLTRAHQQVMGGCPQAAIPNPPHLPGSPYNGLAYCERFPRSGARNSSGGNTSQSNSGARSGGSTGSGGAGGGNVQHWAQVGAAAVSRSNFDSIGASLLSIFQILTLENWNDILVGG